MSNKLIFFGIISTFLVLSFGCSKLEKTPQFHNHATSITLSASANNVSPIASDLSKVVANFSWNDPTLVGGLSNTRFTLVFDTTGNDFVNSTFFGINGVLSIDIIGEEINGLALKYGRSLTSDVKLDVKLIASLSNNNQPVESNVLQITVSPFNELIITTSSESVEVTLEGKDAVAQIITWSSTFKGLLGEKTFNLEYAKSGTDFLSPTTIPVTGYTHSFTQYELNTFAIATGTLIGQDGSIDFRIKCTSDEFGLVAYSPVVSVTVTTYLFSPDELYMTGAAINGWSWDEGIPIKMTTTKSGIFTSNVSFKNETFRFFAQPDWSPTSYNYPYFITVDSNFENAEDDDKNFKFTGSPGNYTITVDFNTKFVVIETPKLFMTGEALNGWSWDEGIYVELTYISNNVYEATHNFNADKSFRFFAQTDWGPISYNYPYFNIVDDDFKNAEDGDKNFQYIGASGSVKIRVDLDSKSVTVMD